MTGFPRKALTCVNDAGPPALIRHQLSDPPRGQDGEPLNVLRHLEGFLQPHHQLHRQKVFAVLERKSRVASRMDEAGFVRIRAPLPGNVAVRAPDIRSVSIHHDAHHEAPRVGERAPRSNARPNDRNCIP